MRPPEKIVNPSIGSAPRSGRWTVLLQNRPWLIYVLPFVAFMLVGTLEPTPEKPGGAAVGLAIPYQSYPLIYTIKIVLTTAAMFLVLPGYRQFPPRVTGLGIVVGIVGAVLWIALVELRLEERLLVPLGVGRLLDFGRRSGFDPTEHLRSAFGLWAFLTLRFVGLVAIVPVVEEFFLRGFVMRFVVDSRWWAVPFGQVNRPALIAGTLIPICAHPAELFAAAAWFSLVTWLMVRTRSIWDCVAAHAITNSAMGIYVVLSGHWWLW